MCGNFWLSGNAITDECYIRDALCGLGHEVYDYNLPLNDTSYEKEIFTRNRPPEVDFAIVFKRTTAEEIRSLRQFTKGPILYWLFDLFWVNDFPNEQERKQAWLCNHFPAAIEADGYLSKEIKWSQGYRDLGVRFFYLPQDTASGTVFNKVTEPVLLSSLSKDFPSDGCDVAFTGTYYDNFGWRDTVDRPTILKAVQERIEPIPLCIFGYNLKSWEEFGFQHVYLGVYDGNYPHLVARTKINLDLSIHRSSDFGCWSNRISKILLGGGFALVKYTGLMETVFGPDGENLVYWNTPPDCADKIRYYLDRSAERCEISERGYQFAKRYLTTEYRVRQLLTILKYEYGVGK
jgi:hypothetical protein